jgi:transglutaminase-like putative cysteine protease
MLAILTSQSNAASVSIPDWMRQAASQSLPTYPADTNAVVLIDNTENVVTGATEYIEHHRRVVKILRKEGRDQGELSVYLAHQQKLISVHAWSIDSANHEYELKDKDFLETSPYSEELYADFHFRSAKAPAAQPGSVIGFEYQVRRTAWVNQLDWFFQEDIPVREAQFTIQLPAGWEYKAAWAGIPAVEPIQSASGWQWTVHDVPAIQDEPRRPAFLALCSRMQVAFFAPGEPAVGSWEGLGQWYLGLTAGRRNPTPAITERVQQLIAGKTDFDGKLRALASFLQSDVRYVAIEIGIGGFQPHTAGDIFHARYGDCKDKATLLSSMLAQAGIRSDYVLINVFRGSVNPMLPAAHSFNHAILAIELPAAGELPYRSVITGKTGRRYLIFDPTDEYTPLGELRSALQETDALLVTDAGGELIHIPLFSPDANALARTGHFSLTDDGTLAGEVSETRSGDHASHERALLRHATLQERAQHLERELNQSLQGFTLESSDIQQLDQAQENLILTLKISAPAYGQVRGPLMLLRPRVLDEKSFAVDTKARHYPIVLGGASRETDVYDIDLPATYTVDDVPDPVSIDVGFASYRSKTEVTGSRLRYSRELIVRKEQVDPAHIDDLRRFEGTVGADEMSAVILKHVSN